MTLNIKNCSFAYGLGKQVLDSLELAFYPGRTALLGPNGAGKSTLLAICANIYSPDEGTIDLDGLSPNGRKERNAYRRDVAWLPQSVSTFPGLRVREHVAYSGWLKGMSRQAAWEGAATAIDVVELTTLQNSPTKALSGGQIRRLGIASALVHDAKVILLDEPTAGLDPRQHGRLRDVLSRVSEKVHVVASTHDIGDIDALFDRVTVMSAGSVKFDGTTSEFLLQGGGGTTAAESAYSTLVALED